MSSHLLALFFACLGTTLWVSWGLLTHVGARAFLDRPDARKIHAVATPRYGGIAFVSVYLVFALWLTDGMSLAWYFLGGLLLFVLGTIDDARILAWQVKLSAQVITAGAIWCVIGKTITEIAFFSLPLHLPSLVIGIGFLIWFLGIVNAVNLIDGMDGLAGGTMLILVFGAALLGAITHRPQLCLLNILLAGTLTGFLHFNSRPAKFFMGDGGSLFLGFHLAVLPILYFATRPPLSTPALDITPTILLSTYLIMDTLRVFFVRLRHQKNPMKPDKQHFHHGLLESTLSYNGTLLIIYAMNAVVVLLALFQEAFRLTAVTMWIYLVLVTLKIVFPPFKDGFIRTASWISARVRRYVRRAPLLPRGSLLKPWLFLGLLIYFTSLLWALFSPSWHWSEKPLLLLTATFLLGSFCWMRRKDPVGKIAFILCIALLVGYFRSLIHQWAVSQIEWEWIRMSSIVISVAILGAIIITKPRAFLLRYWSTLDMLTPVCAIIFTVFLFLFNRPFATIPLEAGFVYFAMRFAVERGGEASKRIRKKDSASLTTPIAKSL